jgi:hypothetical protein
MRVTTDWIEKALFADDWKFSELRRLAQHAARQPPDESGNPKLLASWLFENCQYGIWYSMANGDQA